MIIMSEWIRIFLNDECEYSTLYRIPRVKHLHHSALQMHFPSLIYQTTIIQPFQKIINILLSSPKSNEKCPLHLLLSMRGSSNEI